MFKFAWQKKITITTNQQAEDMRTTFRGCTILAAGFDTETTGLHHIFDKPFLFQFGWVTTDMKGYTYAVDLERTPELAHQVILVWHALVSHVPIYLAHNIKYDLHMVKNIGLPYEGNNIADLTAFIRLGTDAISVDKGGAPMKLKDFAVQFIDRSAKDHERKLKEERTSIASQLNAKLRMRMHKTQKQIDEFFKDKLNDIEDLSDVDRAAYLTWKQTDLPLYLRNKVTHTISSDMIQYNTLNREVLTDYGHLDIVWLLEGWYRLNECIQVRGNQVALQLECDNIRPVFDMERVGFQVNIPYLYACRDKLKIYIRQRREDLKDLAGQTLKVGQHELIKHIIKTQFNVEVTSTGNDELFRLRSDLIHKEDNPQLVEFIETIAELRTLEKWYSTYVMRFITTIEEYHTDRLYTTINTNGTVSGRVTSDFQQFPKKAIISNTGEELFHPRKLVVVDREAGFKGLVYLDYSQIELRLQAMYTILVGHPDTNLCRAYSPYECHTWVGEEAHQIRKNYDYKDPWCIKHAYDYTWYYNEEPEKKWEELDVHGATTKVAFNITETDENFHAMRYVGKRVNFAKNYGAQRGKIAEMFPEFTDEQIDKIDGAYYIAFPGVKEYHNYCYRIAQAQTYATNLFGVRYYNVSGHNLCNMLVQGSGAYFLKWKIRQVQEYLSTHHCKTELQMQIHDELAFEWHEEDNIQIFYDIKKIMETWEDTLIPIVADMEVSYTNWAEKEEVA